MIEVLRQQLQSLQRPPGLEEAGCLPLGVAAVDGALGGGLARGALHEIAAPGEAQLAAATGFALGVAALASLPIIPGRREAANPESITPTAAEYGFRVRGLTPASRNDSVVWIAEDMALIESGGAYGPGLDGFGLAPERLLTVAAGHRRDLLWAMEETLRCRAVGTVIGEMRGGEIDGVAVRRLSLAAAESGALALLLRATPPQDASTAATRWLVGAASSVNDSACFAAQLLRNRRGPAGSWILAWSDADERFELATHAQPVAAPPRHRSHRKVA